MSRLALSYPGTAKPELPIDPQGFPVVVRLTDELHWPTGLKLWRAGDEAGQGVLVQSGVSRFACDSLTLLSHLLARAGFDDVRIDMPSICQPGKTGRADPQEEPDTVPRRAAARA